MQALLGALLLLTAIRTSCQFKVLQSDGLTIRARRGIEDTADGETSKVVATSDDMDDPVASAGGPAQDEDSQTENDDTDDIDDDEGADAGTSSNYESVPEDDEDDEPTSVNENGAVIYTSPNEKPVDIQESPKERQIEDEEMRKEFNGMDDDDDEDDDTSDDGDDDNDKDDNDENGAKDESGNNKNDDTEDNDADIKADYVHDNVDDNYKGTGEDKKEINLSVKSDDSGDTSDSQSDSDNSSNDQSDSEDTPKDVAAESDSADTSDDQSDSDETSDSQPDSGAENAVAESDSDGTSDKQSDSDDTTDNQSDSHDTSDNQSASGDTVAEDAVSESDSDDNPDSQSDSDNTSDNQSDISDEHSGSEDAPEDVFAESDSDDTSDNQSDSHDTAEDSLAADISDSESDSDDISDNQSDPDDTSDSKSDSVDTSKDCVAESDSDNPPDNQPDSGDRSDEQSGSGDTPQDVVAESDSDSTSDKQPDSDNTSANQSDSDDTSDNQSDSGDTTVEQSGSGEAPQDVVAESDADDTSDSQPNSDDTSNNQSDSEDTAEDVVAESDSDDAFDSQSDSVETAEDSIPAETPDNQSDSSETPDSQPDVVAESESGDTSENQSDSDDTPDNQSDSDDTPDNQSDSDPDRKSSPGETPEDVVANSGDTADTESDSGDTADTDTDTESDSGDTADTDTDTESDSGDTADTESDPGDTADIESDSKDDSDALPDSEDSTAKNTNNVAKLRKKRLALANPLKRWPKAIFPYSYSNSLSENGKKNSLAAIGYMSRYTCMEFVPYKGPKTNKELGLGHPGHLIFDNSGGCWSYVGLLRRAQGQVVSCVTRTIFIHEIGHTAFMLHEQVGENRKGLIRINYQNIANSWKSQYKSLPAKGTLSYTGYDMSSMTHYPINMGSKNGRPAMSVLFEAPEFHVGGNMYYMMAEINKGYSCTAQDCPELANKCLMDSYAVKRDEQCECVCVEGLDPATHCAKPKKAARKIEGWGPGKMAMFKPKSGCPDGMSEGTLNQEGDISGSTSAFFPLDGTVGAKTSLVTCIMDGGTGKWPQGRYCFIQAGDHCPEGFESGSFKLGKKDGGINELRFCCKDDGYDYETIQMKNEGPFTLFMKHRMCQVIEDMKSYSGWVFLDGTSVSIEGSLPVNNIVWRINAVKLHYCYYVPLKYGCGEAIELTDAKPTSEISTPNYPDNYPPSTSCTWIVSTPDKDSVIVLDFDDSTFCLEKGDHVDIHSSKIGQPPTRVRGKGYKPSVVTLYNKLKIQFMSDLQTECSGFKAKLRMVKKEDQSYLLDDEGSSYRGTISFTHNMLPCLPWSQMTSCPHHSLATGDENDGLESNYCRNPGDGIAPWCYIYKDNCERNYCDVSLIGRAADNYPDCEEIVSKDPDFCKDKDNAMRGCFKTCQDSIKYERHPKKAGEITCSKPNVLPDSQIVDDVKNSYKLGDSVFYQCSSGPGEVERVCTTTGDWTPAAYACGACGNGWQTFNGACYRYVANTETYTNANAHCEKLKAKITSIRSKEESDFVASLADPGTSQWLGMTASLNDGYKWYTWDDNNDGVIGRYTNWRRTPVLFRLKRRRNAIMLGNMQMKWKIVRDKKYKPWFPFTCKKPSGKRPCLDMLQNCQDTAREVPDACHRYQQWANNMCRKTCGVCGNPSECDVPKPEAGSMVDLVTKGTNVKAGHAVHYKCADDYTVSRGKLSLTCLGTGKLTGSPPVCVAKSSLVRLSNDNDIHPRSGVFGNLHTYTGSGEQYAIAAGGKVIGWQFYAQRAGSTVFQVWRHTGEDPTLLKFIGQNEIKVKAIRLHNVSIPVSVQIAVDAGDIIGIWNPQGSAGVPYNNYVIEGQHGLRLSRRIWSKDEFSSDIEYRFVEENPVKTMSFKAMLGPA